MFYKLAWRNSKRSRNENLIYLRLFQVLCKHKKLI